MKISCIIPAYNEEKTIVHVLGVLKKISSLHEIIVVIDGSTDNTYVNAKSVDGIRIIRHNENRGKGAAIKTGFFHSTGDILLYLDADIENLTPRMVLAIVKPIMNGEADFVKSSFMLERGRVTELVAKPLLKILAPMIQFRQPLSGQFAIRRKLMENIKIHDRWGVDVQILLQMVKKGVRIKEVDLGNLIHKKQPIENKIMMAEEVIKAIMSEFGIIANKHKLIIFDFDQTLIKERSIELIAKDFGFHGELIRLRQMHKKGKLTDYEVAQELAGLFRGKTDKDIADACSKLHLETNAERVIDRLKKRQYKIAIISLAFSPIVDYFAKKLGINHAITPILVSDDSGKFTGEIISKFRHNSRCCDSIICKHLSAKELMDKLNVAPEECIAVGDGSSDQCLFRACGLSLAYKSMHSKIGDIKITNLSEVLVYAE